MLILGRECIVRLKILSFGERCIGIEIRAYIGATSLDKVSRQALTLLFVGFSSQIFRQVLEVLLQKGKQRTEGSFIAAVRRSGN